MKKTLPAKYGVQDFEAVKLKSKYGGILKYNTQANLVGHLNNIRQFKNIREKDHDRFIVANYDLAGKKIKFRCHEVIEDPDKIYVPVLTESGSIPN